MVAVSAQAQRFVDVVLARPTSGGRGECYAHLLLVVVWHCIVFPGTTALVEWCLGYGVSIREPWQSWDEVLWEARLLIAIFVGVIALEGAIGFLVFALVNRRQRPGFRLFLRTWWRACGWGTVVVPSLACMAALSCKSDECEFFALLASLVLLALAPAWLVRTELKIYRRSRWRPECPDCGYSLRGLREARCPECGGAFPTKSRAYRRWAVRRLPWDRSPRGAALFAYLKSVACIVFRPARAARGLVIPDRWLRCGRWAVAHLLLTALAAALLADGQEHFRWIWNSICPAEFELPPPFIGSGAPIDRMFIWMAQSVLAWFVSLLLVMAIAGAVSFFVPRRRRAAKLGGVKWSLYATALFPLALVAWYSYYFVFPPVDPWEMYLVGPMPTPPPEVPLWFPVVPYAAWWALGIAANPHNRVRNWTAALFYLSVFFAAWLLVAYALFAPGALEELR